MKSVGPKQKSDGRLPVFVFPTELNFYINDQSSHKQVLTLYNPYDFTVQFKVLCNNPTKYNVVESEGLIKQKCCIDIVIRVTNLHVGGYREDKFRVHIYEHGLPKLLGKKDVIAVLSQSEREETSKSSGMYSGRRTSKDIDELFLQQRRESVIVQRSLPSIPVMIVSLVCVIILMLPAYGDPTANISVPLYLHMSMNQKLIASYILGLVTMAVLKT